MMKETTEETLLQAAKAAGFDNYKITETSSLLFDSRFRTYCEKNDCGNYANNYSCPPACGTPEELREKAQQFEYVLVLQTITPAKNMMDAGEMKGIKKRHNQMTWNFIEQVSDDLGEWLPAMAGPCQRCSPCEMSKGNPCRFPEQKASCLSVFCINVAALAEHCEIPYFCDGKVAFFSLIFFHNSKNE